MAAGLNAGTKLARPEQWGMSLEVLAGMSLEALLYYVLAGAGRREEQPARP